MLSGRARAPLDSAERGPLLETWVRHELTAYQQHASLGGELSYWRTPSKVEVDFVFSGAKRTIGIEVKASERVRGSDAVGLGELAKELELERAVVVYLGERRLKFGPIDVFPVGEFLAALWAGRVL